MRQPNRSSSSSFYYHLYGLNVESDLALPELRPQTAPWNHNSRVKLFLREAFTHWPIETGTDESTLIFRSPQNGSTNNPNVRIEYFAAVRCYRFLYGDGIAFALDHDGSLLRQPRSQQRAAFWRGIRRMMCGVYLPMRRLAPIITA